MDYRIDAWDAAHGFTGELAQDYQLLVQHGLVPRQPHIRSSDFKNHDDGIFYLRRFLGFVPSARDEQSEALSLGTLLHSRLQYHGHPNADELLRRAAKDTLLSESGRRDFELAEAWWPVLCDMQASEDGMTLNKYLKLPWFRTLDVELTISLYEEAGEGQDEGYIRTAQLDRLMYHEQQRTLYIFDLKSTSWPVAVRALQCPVEAQTGHYLDLVSNPLVLKTIIERYGLPADTRVGGMTHFIIQKPKIRPSGEDRDYEIKTKVLRSGPRKGQEVQERDFYGEPKWSNYIERVKEVTRGTDSALISNTSVNAGLTHKYRTRLRGQVERVLRGPIPTKFVETEEGMVDWNRPSPYLPFFVNDWKAWAGIAERFGFRVEHRDPILALNADNPIHLSTPGSTNG